MERAAGEVGEDRVQDRAALGHGERTDQSAHVASHRGDLADAEGRSNPGGVRVPGHVAGGLAGMCMGTIILTT